MHLDQTVHPLRGRVNNRQNYKEGGHSLSFCRALRGRVQLGHQGLEQPGRRGVIHASREHGGVTGFKDASGPDRAPLERT